MDGSGVAPAFAAGALAAVAGMTLAHSCIVDSSTGGAGSGDGSSRSGSGGGGGSRSGGGSRAGRALERRYTGDGLLESGGAGAGIGSADVADVDASHFIGAATKAQRQKLRVTVLGGGNFGTAMAYAASRNGHEVTLWMRDTAQARYFNETQRNPKYLSEFSLPKNVRATTDLVEAMAGVQLIIHALPCQKTPEWLAEHKDSIPCDVLICSTVKGLYLPTKQLIGHAMCEALGRDQPLAYLSGPSFSIEIMKDYPTSVVVASRELFHATLVQRVLSNMAMRVYTSQDVVGVQLGGALKNPLAVGAGMIAGLGFGTNTLSAAVTRSTAELTALCVAMGGKPETISGLAGVGDLMLTAFSAESRNQRCGQRLVKGEKIEEILKDMTVEGVATAPVAVAFADLCGLELPLFRCVDDLISARIEPKQAMARLMGRKLRQEGQDEMWRKGDSSAT